MVVVLFENAAAQPAFVTVHLAWPASALLFALPYFLDFSRMFLKPVNEPSVLMCCAFKLTSAMSTVISIPTLSRISSLNVISVSLQPTGLRLVFAHTWAACEGHVCHEAKGEGTMARHGRVVLASFHSCDPSPRGRGGHVINMCGFASTVVHARVSHNKVLNEGVW